MTNVLLVYPPFCTPSSPPYSVTNLYSKLKTVSSVNVNVLDLNIKFHNYKFKKYKDYFQRKGWSDYDFVSKKCREDFNKAYAHNHKLILDNELPEQFDGFLDLILDYKPEVVAFSIVYSSQVFYAFSLIKKLKSLNIKTIVGGPAVSEKLKNESNLFMASEGALFNFLKINPKESFLDFSVYDFDDYFTPEIVLPLKTSSTCFYKKCAFCSHFSNEKYEEFDLDFLESTIKNNSANKYFLIDDMIHSKRLLSLAKIFKKYNVEWACQLKPTKDFSKKILSELKSSGLKFVLWGVESANNRVLNLMSKNTNKDDISLILKNSKESGVLNVVYIMFGFPSESKDEFLETINFLHDNKKNIDLVSTSVFGLQKGTKVYNNPEDFFITKIFEEKRTFLEPKISYASSTGLSSSEAFKLRKSYLNFLDDINKFPKKLNFFREHMFFY